MDFRQRLQKAAQRGQRVCEKREAEAAAAALNEEEYKRLHAKYRLALTEHIDQCLRQLADQFPGFRFENVVSDEGWGAAVQRDDIHLADGQRENLFSRLQLVVSPFSKYHVLDLAAKGTIHNKESFTRNHYRLLSEYDAESFHELVDLWVLDYAEQFAAAD